VTAEAGALDAAEHVGEIEVALAGLQVHLVAAPKAIGQPHFLDLRHVERRDKPVDPLRHEMRMVDRERQAKRRRPDLVEIEAPLVERVRQIVHLGLGGLLVEVFQQHQRALPLGIGDDPQ